MPYCVRVLTNLALSIEAVAGKEGVGRLVVLLHLTQAQADACLPVLRMYHFCGCACGARLWGLFANTLLHLVAWGMGACGRAAGLSGASHMVNSC